MVIYRRCSSGDAKTVKWVKWIAGLKEKGFATVSVNLAFNALITEEIK